jgi:hypothetical protein
MGFFNFSKMVYRTPFFLINYTIFKIVKALPHKVCTPSTPQKNADTEIYFFWQKDGNFM